MTVFPQMAFYPITKKSHARSVVNVLGDGSVDRLGDSAGASVHWEMQAKGMTAVEWNALESLFESVAGRWKSFTFLDPVGNLLAQSENFGVGPWVNGALIQLTSGIVDPFGTTRATSATNTGQGAETIAQTLNVPGTFTYCVSMWARGSQAALFCGGDSKVFVLGPQWTRISFTGSPGVDSAAFGLSLEAGVSVDLFGMQVEAQRAASDYKMTTVAGGVYSNARFAEDRIAVTAQGSDVYDATIRIVSVG